MRYTQQDVIDHLGLVHMIAQRMKPSCGNYLIDYDDLVSEGTLGLIKALDRFDPERGFQFSSFAFGYIRGTMLLGNRTLFKERWQARRRGQEVHTVSIHSHTGSEMIPGTGDQGRGSRQVFENTHHSAILERIRKVLTPPQQQILHLLIEDNLTPTEAAEVLGISHQAVSLRYQGAIRRARKRLVRKEVA